VAWGSEFTSSQPGGKNADKPGWRAYGKWIAAHQNLFMYDSSGKPFMLHGNPPGYISPQMPLDQADWPTGITNAVYADWVAVRLASLCKLSGCRGFFAADFVEGQPYIENGDFNPRIISAFAAADKLSIPKGTVGEQAMWILNNHRAEWYDYLCDGYAYFYGATVREVHKATGQTALVAAQTHLDPAIRRGRGTDFRRYVKFCDPKEMYFQIELQSDSLRKVPAYGNTMVKMGEFACREPLMVLGSHMDADLEKFWVAVSNTKRNLTADEQHEWGLKYLKHHWLTVGFAHIATRDGEVRRATGAFLRHYWDHGKTDPTVVNLIRSVQPVRPFGPALYYSVPVERSIENEGPGHWWNITTQATSAWQNLPFGYFVSDVAVAKLQSANAPSGWLVFDGDRMSAEERSALTKIAPIIDPANPGDQPLTFSKGVSGFAFYDQVGRLFVIATNTGDTPTPDAQITLRGLRDGHYQAIDQLNPDVAIGVTVAQQTTTIKLPLERWDTRVIAIPGLPGAKSPAPVAEKAK
jgi:hypothetical protein